MKSTPSKPLFILIALLAIGQFQSRAANDGPSPAVSPAPQEKTVSPYSFTLLPKAFQQHPVLAISVITDMTAEGKKCPPPTPANPCYYYCHSSGYHQEGQGASEEGAVSDKNMMNWVQKVLASQNYLPANREHPATLLLFFFWGVHSKLDLDPSENGDNSVRDVGHHNLLSRAALVGGAGFAKDLAEALKQRDLSSGGPTMSFLDPVYRFANRDTLTSNLMEQVFDDCYYVVISAFDAFAFAQGEKKLLWRTKMSTPAQSVSLAETASALVASGGPFLGREMAQASIVGKRISRSGTVELGELKVIATDEKLLEKQNQETPPGKK
jgi:hypothetical protein